MSLKYEPSSEQVALARHLLNKAQAQQLPSAPKDAPQKPSVCRLLFFFITLKPRVE